MKLFKIIKTNCLVKLYGDNRLAPSFLDQFAFTIPVNETAKKNYHLSLLHVSSICCRSQNWYQSLRTDDSFTGCHVAVWSSFGYTKGFCLHFHNTQLYSGECPIETLNLNQSRLFNLHSSYQRENPLQWLDDFKKKFKNLLTIHLTRNIFVAVLLDLLDIDFWRRLLYALCTEIPKQRTLRRFLLRWNIVKK